MLSVIINNVIGQVVYSKKFENRARLIEQIDLSEQPEGIYIIKVQSQKILKVEKIVIK